jgi:hypothetical protein
VEGVRGQSLVKRGIEHRHLRNLGSQLKRKFNPGKVCRVVQRGQRGKRPYTPDRRTIDPYRLAENIAAVYDAVTDGRELPEVFQCPGLTEKTHNVHQPVMMVGNHLFCLSLVNRRCVHVTSVAVLPNGFADAFNRSRDEHNSRVYIEKAVFYGRTARIEDQYFHICRWLSCA